MSETIRVRSILGRYLEHSRVFAFGVGENRTVFIGSADMMHRNLDRRIEALVELTEPGHITEIDDIFTLAMSDETSAWALEADGTWTRHSRSDSGKPLEDLQTGLMQRVGQRGRSRR